MGGGGNMSILEWLRGSNFWQQETIKMVLRVKVQIRSATNQISTAKVAYIDECKWDEENSRLEFPPPPLPYPDRREVAKCQHLPASKVEENENLIIEQEKQKRMLNIIVLHQWTPWPWPWPMHQGNFGWIQSGYHIKRWLSMRNIEDELPL